MPEAVLTVEGVHQSYQGAHALVGVDLEVGSGARVAIVGPNGAGKTSLLKVIAGLVPTSRGNVVWFGKQINKLSAWQRSRLGISLCPEQRRVFTGMSVAENLSVGGHRLKGKRVNQRRDFVLSVFPALEQRLGQDAANLSGGEQQMLAIARALMPEPRLLLLDEPTLGLSPRLAQEVLGSLRTVSADSSVVVVEQNARAALRVTQHGYVLLNGRMRRSGTSAELLDTTWDLGGYAGVSK